MFGIWGSSGSAVAPNEQEKKRIIDTHTKNRLEYDPLYLICTVATIALSLKNSISYPNGLSPQEILQRSNYKITFGQNGIITIDKPGYYQGLSRGYNGADYTDLSKIKLYVVKLLNCCEFQSDSMKTILKTFKIGLEIILKGYLEDDNAYIKVQQGPEGEKHSVDIPLSHKKNNQMRIIHDLIMANIKLVEKALKFDTLSPENQQKFRAKIEKENFTCFPTDSLRIQQSDNTWKTIDEVLSEKMKILWTENKLSGIANLMSSEADSTCDSGILNVISNVPGKFNLIQSEIEIALKAALQGQNLVISAGYRQDAYL